jgi:hypothetical protein
MKWSVGRPRPEEIAMQIANSIITEADGVPEDVVTAVKDMELTRAEAFTHYMPRDRPFTRPGRRCIQPPARLLFGSLWWQT